MTHNPEMTRSYGRQYLDERDRARILAALDSPFLTQGPLVPEFEQALCDATGAKYAVAVANGTVALHLACAAAGIGPGNITATQDITFVASANAGLYCGAETVLTDVEPGTISMSPQGLARACPSQPAAAIPVHFAGLSSLKERLNARYVIEDACHGLGGIDPLGKPIGACAVSDMSVFSFHPVKSITTGEGGAITTNDAALAKQLRLLRNHGLVREPSEWLNPEAGHDGAAPNPWYYEQVTLGFNARMTELQAALGLGQMEKLPWLMERRRLLAHRYLDCLDGAASIAPLHQADQIARSANHLFVALIDFDAIGLSRRQVMEQLRAADIGTQVHYIPVHHQPYHASRAPHAGGFPNADAYYRKCLSLPLHPGMAEEDVVYVASILRRICSSSQ